VAWCDTYDFVHSRERGDPHSVVGLLFSFQRPSLTPGSENESRFPALDSFGVSRTTVLRRGGRLLHQPPSCRQEIMPTLVRHASGAALGARNIATAPWVSSAGSSVSRVPLLDPSTVQTLWKSPRDILGLSCGARLSASRPPPGTPARFGIRSVRGARFLAPLAGCVNSLRKKVDRTDQAPHADRSARAIRQASAIASAAGSEEPERRARAAREIAARRPSASSIRSFTTTYP